jgi:hypothetical protein
MFDVAVSQANCPHSLSANINIEHHLHEPSRVPKKTAYPFERALPGEGSIWRRWNLLT